MEKRCGITNQRSGETIVKKKKDRQTELEGTTRGLHGFNTRPEEKIMDKLTAKDYETPEEADAKLQTKFNMWAYDFENFHKIRVAAQMGLLAIKRDMFVTPEVLDAIDQLLLTVKQIASTKEKKALDEKMSDARKKVSKILTAAQYYQTIRIPYHPAWPDKCYEAARDALNSVYAIRQLRGMGMKMLDEDDEADEFLNTFGSKMEGQ